MKASIAAILISVFSLATAVAIEGPDMTAVRREVLLLERQGVNANRPVTNGACCVAGVSKKQDVCNVNGQQGKCVPASSANCNEALTCIQNNKLKCDANVLENGRPLCRPV